MNHDEKNIEIFHLKLHEIKTFRLKKFISEEFEECMYLIFFNSNCCQEKK